MDVAKYNKIHVCKVAIVGSGYAPRHLARVFGNLKHALLEAEVPGNIINKSAKESEWQVMMLSEILVNVMVESFRAEMDF